MVGDTIAFVLRNLPAILLVLALILGPILRGPESFIASVLSWFLLLPIGVTGIWACHRRYLSAKGPVKRSATIPEAGKCRQLTISGRWRRQCTCSNSAGLSAPASSWPACSSGSCLRDGGGEATGLRPYG
jgi:hypothetical protein